jgi:hypothetical protein
MLVCSMDEGEWTPVKLIQRSRTSKQVPAAPDASDLPEEPRSMMGSAVPGERQANLGPGDFRARLRTGIHGCND